MLSKKHYNRKFISKKINIMVEQHVMDIQMKILVLFTIINGLWEL